MAEKPSFSGKFLHCKINKHHPLGTGSYATVYQATYEELPCAAKVLHRNLFEIGPQSYQLVERFEQECELLSKIRHPCIVQFLGVARDSGSRLPVLVMELMEDSLTKFLERSDTELPIHLQVNFCHDVALALAYLHSRGITHRDLSSNNVLLIAGTRAKVTDFGTSVFKSEGLSDRLTSCPGTQPYMAPECFGDEVQYSQSVDCFSFGVLVVQIITRKFPNPSARLVLPPRSRSLFRSYEGYMRMVPEVDRRQNHISLVDQLNPLRQTFMHCLKNIESARPSAHDICRSLVAIKKGSPLYKESIDNTSDYQHSIMKQYDALRDEVQSNASELKKVQSEIDDYRQENSRLRQQNYSLERQVNGWSQRVQQLEIQNIELEEKQHKGTQSRGFFKGLSMFGDRERELESTLQTKNAQLRRVLDENSSYLKRIATLQEEVEQKRQYIATKDRERREKSDELKNAQDKLDALEVDLGLERIKKIKQLEETVQELEESKLQRDELEEQLDDLRVFTTFERRNQERSHREIISQKDETIEDQNREIESLKQQLKDLTSTLNKSAQRSDTEKKRPKQSSIITEITSEDESSKETTHQLDLDCLSGDSDGKETWNLISFQDVGTEEEFEVESDDLSINLEKECPSLSPVSSNHSRHATDSDSEVIHPIHPVFVIFSSLDLESPSSGNSCSKRVEEELSEGSPSSPRETGSADDSSSSPTPERSISFESLQITPRDQEYDPCDNSEVTFNDLQPKECPDGEPLPPHLGGESIEENSLESENTRSPITETLATEQNQSSPSFTENKFTSIARIKLQPSHEGESQGPSGTEISQEVILSPIFVRQQSDMATQTMPESRTPSQLSDASIDKHSTAQTLKSEQQSTTNAIPEDMSQICLVQTSQPHSGSYYLQSTTEGQKSHVEAAKPQHQSQTHPLSVQLPTMALSSAHADQLSELFAQWMSVFLQRQLRAAVPQETIQVPATVAPLVSACTTPSHQIPRCSPQQSSSDTQDIKMSDCLHEAQKDEESDSEQSLSGNHKELPQVSTTQTKQLESIPLCPQNNDELQPREDQAEQPSPQNEIIQSQTHQFHADQPSKQSESLAAQKNVNEHSHRQQLSSAHTSSVNESKSPAIDISQSFETNTKSQPPLITPSPVQMLPTETVYNLEKQSITVTPQTQFQNKCGTTPPTISVQRKGILAQQAAGVGKEHVRSPEQDSSTHVELQQALIDQTSIQTIPGQQQQQLSQKDATCTGHIQSTVESQCESSQGATPLQQSLHPSYVQVSKPQSPQAPASPPICTVGQSSVQHSSQLAAGSILARRPTCIDLHSSSLPTLPEEAPDQFQQQEIACSHVQHPMQPSHDQQPPSGTEHDKQQMNIKTCAQQQSMDTKQIASNQQMTQTQNLMIGSQETNILEKNQPQLTVVKSNISCKGMEASYSHMPTDQHNNKVIDPNSQQQACPGDLKANMTITASNILPPGQMHQHTNNQSGVRNSRQIPFPQTGNVHVHTTPVRDMHSVQLEHAPVPHPPYNQSNTQVPIPTTTIGLPPYTFRGGQSVPSGNLPPNPDHYGMSDNKQLHIAETAPHQYYTTTEETNNVSYQGSLSNYPNTSRGPYHGPHHSQGLPQPQNSANRAGQSYAAYASHPDPNTHHPLTTSQVRYGQQSSLTSEESRFSSLAGNHPSPQVRFDTQQSSPANKQHQQETATLRGTRHSVHNQGQMAAQHMQGSLPSGQQGSENVMSHAYMSSEAIDPELPHLAAERQKLQYSYLGSFSSPDQLFHQRMQFQRAPPPDRRQHQSGSPVYYPRNFSEPNLPHSYRGGRRPYPSHRPTRTAPQIIIVQQPYEPYHGYGEEYGYHHIRYTEQHYPEYAYGYGGNFHDDRGQQFGQQVYHEPDPHRYPYHERNPSWSSATQTHRQTSSRSDDSSVSVDSPRSVGSSGPADTYPFISHQKDEELIQVLGTSEKAEEYSVVLIQPQYTDDLSLPWTATFAVCRRHPNCINALLEIIQGPSGSKYNVAHINAFFEPEGELRLDIPYEKAMKQGYTITTDVSPCLIRKWEATPHPDRANQPHADAVYPPRHTLTILPHSNEERQRLNIQLKLLGAKDCVRHFVLTSPLPSSSAHQNTTRQFTSTHLYHTQPLTPPVEQMGALQHEPDSTMFLHMVSDRISPKWRALGSYLGVPQNELDQIALTTEQSDSTRCSCVVKVVEYWKTHLLDRPSTWDELIMAVKQVDETLAFSMKRQLLVSRQMPT